MVTSSLAPASLPAGSRIYAIGDVHGCRDQLADMHAQIAADLAARPVADALVLHLGDYVDRGPDSAGVVEMLRAGAPVPGARALQLMGNHEALMLAALAGDRRAAQVWLENGGVAALASWKVPPRTDPAAWAGLIPPAALAWLRGLARSHQAGGYLFVHAGIRPGIAIAAQDPDDLIWIREPFLSWTEPHEKVVVHGHTPVRAPAIRPNRIGIDTGAVLGGMLTCAVLEADRLGFLTA